jgi:GTPase SAR1 family protein
MNARDNPFTTERVLRIRYALPDGDWPQLLARLQAHRYRAAIVGPHGAGKTTLLEDLQQQLETRGVPTLWLRRDTDRPHFTRDELNACFATITPQHVICLDGAEQLTRWGWMWFKRRARAARGLIVTSHHPGLLPTLHTCTTNERLLEEIVGRLLSPTPLVSPASLPTSHDLFVKHRGNLRDALRELYDCYAAC